MGKYKKGELITSLDEMMNQELIWRNRPVAREWFKNWQLKYAKSYIERGFIFKVKKIKEEKFIC